MSATASLPRGRHGLSRDEVESHQRLRILAAIADTMAQKGYAATSVADIIRGAGVSRETFYQLYDNKLDAFMAAFDTVAEVVVEALATTDGPTSPTDRIEALIEAYLGLVAATPEWARLFLVEVHAAGPDAIARRAEIQERIVDAITAALDTSDPTVRFDVRVIVAAIGPLVEAPLVRGDIAAIAALGAPLRAHVHHILASRSAGSVRC